MTRRDFMLRCVVSGSMSMLLLSGGCRRTEIDGPPQLRVGRDECAECGMLISEDRCACAFLIEHHGAREYAMFDDIGCMLDYEHDGRDGVRILRGYVRDHDSRLWTPSDEAVFLFADRDRLLTPMGSGIVAFGSADAAGPTREAVGGELMDWSTLVPARRAWMEERYGKRRAAP